MRTVLVASTSLRGAVSDDPSTLAPQASQRSSPPKRLSAKAEAIYVSQAHRLIASLRHIDGRLRRLVEQLAADQHAADFAGAGADLVELCVAQEAAGRIFVDVAVAAEQLDRIQRALRG